MMEMMAVLLLITTVLGMGIPAMLIAERKAWVNQAMNEVLRIHNICMSLQRELAARGIPGKVNITITTASTGSSTAPPPPPTLTVTGPIGFDLASRLGVSPTNIPINADGFIYSINGAAPNSLVGTVAWNYEERTGFIEGGSPISLTFNAIPTGVTSTFPLGTTFRVKRTLVLYPQGYSEVP